ncbi:HepT-like ribonuclease domain-containing protein [Flexistipes sp.]|uniref:HepT-like ribonuclease domain-containing protein n=1 Tax=Flexistipes sp. TaxID=3088135 RepID=UPI002E1A21AF|nr:HepT-like ribonuclease domain-containing protein [Flexistipes sp.]
MSKRIEELFLFDIYVAILKIQKTVEKFENSEELLHDFNAWDSVIREFEIIGEAARHLIGSNILDENARVVVDFRNLLIHNYFGIDPEEVWDVVINDLPYFTNDILDQINKIEELLKKELIEAYCEHNKYLDFVIEKLQVL